MTKILIVDDEPKIRTLIRKYAEYEHFDVEESYDGYDAIYKVENHDFDVIILDVMMPEMDGFSACKYIRERSDAPIIMLTSKSNEQDRIFGFTIGVDDYVLKPFSPTELMLRIHAILNRTKGIEHTQYVFKGLNINFSSHQVSIDQRKISLAPKEIDLLFYLVKNKGIALTREQIVSRIWGYDYDKDDRTLDTHIKLLRKKLGAYQNCIVTIRGLGYRFDEE